MDRIPHRNSRSNTARLRTFGLTLGAVCTLVSGLAWWRGSGGWPYLLTAALLLAGSAVGAPILLRPVFKSWMLLAAGLNWLMTRLILSLLFYLVVTPIGLLARLAGKHGLERRWRVPELESYWVARNGPRGKESYDRQY
jgi:hypothetical protein